jgi:hypothetical protein
MLAPLVRVVYVLDPTFDNRYVVSVDRRRKFQILIWTYGYFPAEAYVLLTNGSYAKITGEVRWPGRPPEEEEEEEEYE